MKIGAVGLLAMHAVALLIFAGGIYLSLAVFVHWWPTAAALLVLLPAEVVLLRQRTQSRGFRIPAKSAAEVEKHAGGNAI